MPKPKIHNTQAPSSVEAADLTRRALTAWHKAGEATPQEASTLPVTARLASKLYKSADLTAPHQLHFVVVHAGAHTLAVYRVHRVHDYFMLRRMVRPPKDLIRLRG